MVAATLPDGRPDPDLPFHALLGHFTVSVTVPPLRCRPEDLATIVDRLLAQLAPNRRVRLSPQAERTLARYPWPGNVPQLHEALEYAVHRRPVGEIRTEDLPSYCHTSKIRPLTPLETAERDAITAALHECGGNRQAAAHQLGLSRSSLYRKLHRYGITL
ncbi:Transcriptional regulatory protein ZraR [bioreactor metagenome]|uniref:Transcriptional regulatory protein ZraR n=2 Tax=root TaxID=1 RepID=A0A645EJJ3_9ZZZZ